VSEDVGRTDPGVEVSQRSPRRDARLEVRRQCLEAVEARRAPRPRDRSIDPWLDVLLAAGCMF